MRGSRAVAWLMLAVWGAWFVAVQAILASGSGSHVWVPDLGLVLIVACALHLEPRDVPKAAFILGFSRIAYSVEPPAAILAGAFGAAVLVRSVRLFAEVSHPLVRAVLAGLASTAFSTWLAFVHAVRHGFETGPVETVFMAAFRSLPSAFTSALLVMFLAPALVRLPGLTPLRDRRW